MTSWADVEAAAPELAALVRARFEATGLAFLATLRTDGSPRITGVEPTFEDGELVLGMMAGSRKGADLRRDPRLALHAASVDKEVKDGDAKVAGRAVLVNDDPHDRWHVDITEVSLLRPGEPLDHLVIQWWRPGEDVTTRKRY
ncbi:MAG TPA: pyridoxamine 5'-phosphate oxidase family protein [Acidimicrobiales bacterium]|nr:pyridoxamine 5'-phosphate oxidase family protein [Acidimicrobiales bacterium]